MFYGNIGIDLHFIYEGDLQSPETPRVFSQYQNSGQLMHPSGQSLISAFLLNEIGRSLSKFQSPFKTPAPGQTPVQSETILLETAHTNASARFLVRVWRSPSVFDASDSQQDVQADEITIRMISRSPSGQTPRILYEAPPIPFPANQPSMWLDAGLLLDSPESDVAVTVTRPSPHSSVVALFNYQEPSGLLARFPGMPVSGSDAVNHLNLRNVIAGSNDEHALRQLLAGYLAKHGMEQAGPSVSALDCRKTNENPASSVSTPAVYSQPQPSSRTSSFSPTSTLGVFFDSSTPPNAISNSSSQRIDLPATPPQGSPPLTHRARSYIGSAIANIATTIAHSRTSSSASSVSPAPPQSFIAPETHVETPVLGTLSSTTPQSQTERQPLRKPRVRSLSESDSSTDTTVRCLLNGMVDCLNQVETYDDGGPAENSLLALQDTTSQAPTQAHSTSNTVVASVVSTTIAECSAPRKITKSTQTSVPEQMLVANNGNSNDPTIQAEQPILLSSVCGIPAPVAPSTGAELLGGDAENDIHAVQPTTIQDCPTEVQMEDSANNPLDQALTHDTSNANAAPQTYADVTAREGTSNVGPPSESAASEPQNTSTPLDTNVENGRPPSAAAAAGEANDVSANSAEDVEFVSCTRSNQNAPSDDGVSTPPPPQNGGGGSTSGAMVIHSMAASGRAASSIAGRGRRSSASRAPSTVTSSGSSFKPSAERQLQMFNYLKRLVSEDQKADVSTCDTLLQAREAQMMQFEMVKKKYEQTLIANNQDMAVAGAQLRLKRDTMRLLRSQHRSYMTDRGYRSKTFAEARMGSDRRPRSISGGPVGSRCPSIAGSRVRSRLGSRAGTPQEVPASWIKRERIDLSREDNVSERTGRRAASISQTLGGALGLDRATREGTCKVGNVNDLLKNPPIAAAKRSGSCVPGNAPATSTSRAGTPSSSRHSNQPDADRTRAITEWREASHHARAATEATTDADLMPPPSLPVSGGISSTNPIVIADDEPSDRSRSSVREGKKRARSVSRSASVCSRISTASNCRKRTDKAHNPSWSRSTSVTFREGSVPASPIVVQDNDSNTTDKDKGDAGDQNKSKNKENDEPVFLGQTQTQLRGSRASSVSSDFSTLFDSLSQRHESIS